MSEVEDELLMKHKYKRYHITIGFVDGIMGDIFLNADFPAIVFAFLTNEGFHEIRVTLEFTP